MNTVPNNNIGVVVNYTRGWLEIVTTCLGQDAASQCADAISKVLGQEFGHEMTFRAILNDDYQEMTVGYVRLTEELIANHCYSDNSWNGKIHTIKVIRKFTDMGLRTAKDIVDEIERNVGKWVPIVEDSRNVMDAIARMKELGQVNVWKTIAGEFLDCGVEFKLCDGEQD